MRIEPQTDEARLAAELVEEWAGDFRPAETVTRAQAFRVLSTSKPWASWSEQTRAAVLEQWPDAEIRRKPIRLPNGGEVSVETGEHHDLSGLSVLDTRGVQAIVWLPRDVVLALRNILQPFPKA